jgi:hypothetical protein
MDGRALRPVRMPAVDSRSLTAIGTPASGPTCSPADIRCSRRSALTPRTRGAGCRRHAGSGQAGPLFGSLSRCLLRATVHARERRRQHRRHLTPRSRSSMPRTGWHRLPHCG